MARRCVGVGPGFSAQRGAVRTVALEVNIGPLPEAAPVGRGLAMPSNNESASGKRRHRREVLVAGGSGIDQKLAAGLAAVCAVTLAVYPRASLRVLALGSPDGDKAAALKRRHRGIALRPGLMGVDPEFLAVPHRDSQAHRHAGGGLGVRGRIAAGASRQAVRALSAFKRVIP